MFYKMIENKCTQWYESERCTVKNLIEYIEKTGQMRDAQIEAIKVYLFLKIACECKPLTQLFRQGFFNSIDLNEIELSKSTREYLFQNPAAATLFEYACLTNDKGEQVSEKLEKQIKKDPTGIDYNEFFRNAFYGVSYTDYLFSLPMGAGKTYLMAAFIYLDLYFAYNEPTNPSFAHNFIIFAPSGLKSSVVPSLKTIQNFNPSWILPEPAATDIKRMISFEVLDQSKTAKKSNKTKNPNVQKIANHQPLSELFGLVAVTNAEKVILERIQEKQGQINMFEESEDDKDRQANELRNLIGKLPSLSIFIDEVHHAVSDEIKLRAVVTRWAQNHTVNSVIGFSGTPYLDKVEKIKVVDSLSIGTAEITNIVYYYPLIDGVGNFLKRPVVKIADIADSSLIIEKGVREFLDTYKDTVYAEELGATVRSADITEILISDLLEFVHQYSVPRYKLKNRSGKNNSQQGTDVIAYKYKNEDKTPNDKDELVAAEVKATLSNMEYTPIKNAIIDSRKDEHRLARSVNYCRKRLKELGKIEEAEEVKRFLFKPDNNYRITYVAAGVSSRENVDDAIELGFSGEELEIRKNELIFYVHGQKLMELAHNIYQRCCK